MPQSNYQEPIEKEDLDLVNKFTKDKEKSNTKPQEKSMSPEKERMPLVEAETAKETQEVKVSRQIETTRKTLKTQKTAAAPITIQDDAKTVAQATDFEKKVEKLVELALQKGPEHAIRVAQHMDANDNYTLDELHDKMLEDDLRKQLIQKGLLKEL